MTARDEKVAASSALVAGVVAALLHEVGMALLPSLLLAVGVGLLLWAGVSWYLDRRHRVGREAEDWLARGWWRE